MAEPSVPPLQAGEVDELLTDIVPAVTARVLGVLLPQELLAVTVMLPEVVLEVTLMEFVVDEPVQPEGNVQV